MNNIVISIIIIVIFTSVMSIVARFFDIHSIYYVPFMMWIIALGIFNMFLDKDTENIFMKDIINF